MVSGDLEWHQLASNEVDDGDMTVVAINWRWVSVCQGLGISKISYPNSFDRRTINRMYSETNIQIKPKGLVAETITEH